MNGRPAIEIHGLSKRYRIGGGAAFRYGRLTEALWTSLRRTRPNPTEPDQHVWALRGVDLEIAPGTAVGFIGRNGAGKSTLLKVVSRITAPTEGTVRLRGRVGSLLDVGTGFHPELTGRENIYLSGAVLGMRRREIARQFDAIVEFSGSGRFVDTPVKRYSSGMYVRLAFAVAAHLDTEILVIDEVLSIGDLDFQKRCLGRVEELEGLGRTVLFVSHNMGSVLRVCPRVVLLDQGRVVADGPAATVVDRYLASGGGAAERTWDGSGAPGDDLCRLRSVRVADRDGAQAHEVEVSEPIDLEVWYERADDADPGLRTDVVLEVCTQDGIVLFSTTDANELAWRDAPRPPGTIRSTCTIPANLLAEGTHTVHVRLCSWRPYRVHALARDAVSFQVVDRTEGDGVRADSAHLWPGLVRPMLEWRVRTEALEPPDAVVR